MDAAGRTALVTGGASGLGRATVGLLVERGARCVILDLPGSASPASTRSSRLHVVENGYLNGETIRLDGAIRMPPR
jgi:2-keto-3-deoxy-L-fuconate dehydrogenase